MESAFFRVGNHVRGSRFRTGEGAEEFFFTVESPDGVTFEEELDGLYTAYREALKSQGLDEDTLVFTRFHVGDITNQKERLLSSRIFGTARRGAVSIIEQCPVCGGSVSLLAWHLREEGRALPHAEVSIDGDGWRNGALIRGKHYSLLWTSNFTADSGCDSLAQTTRIFQDFRSVLDENGMNLFDSTVRTWVYVRDIDNHYHGMVKARKSFFQEHGLQPETKYIASTGIEGCSKEVNTLVSLDALSVGGLKNEQFVRMEALDHLSPTIKYGVTFERGMRIRYGDRSHLYISGTASIDREGTVLHLSDVRKQTARTLENINALLAPQGAGLRDLAYIVVYLRSFKDRDRVWEVLEKELPKDIPVLTVLGPVCRPTWLVEIEGVAVIPDHTEYPPFL